MLGRLIFATIISNMIFYENVTIDDIKFNWKFEYNKFMFY